MLDVDIENISDTNLQEIIRSAALENTVFGKVFNVKATTDKLSLKMLTQHLLNYIRDQKKSQSELEQLVQSLQSELRATKLKVSALQNKPSFSTPKITGTQSLSLSQFNQQRAVPSSSPASPAAIR